MGLDGVGKLGENRLTLLFLHAHLLERLIEGCLEAVDIASPRLVAGVFTPVCGILSNSFFHDWDDRLWHNARLGAFLELFADFTLRQCIFATLVNIRVDPLGFLVPMFAIATTFLPLGLLG